MNKNLKRRLKIRSIKIKILRKKTSRRNKLMIKKIKLRMSQKNKSLKTRRL